MEDLPGIRALKAVVLVVILGLLSFYAYMTSAFLYWKPSHFIHVGKFKSIQLAGDSSHPSDKTIP